MRKTILTAVAGCLLAVSAMGEQSILKVAAAASPRAMGGSPLGASRRQLHICRNICRRPLAIELCAPLPLELADAQFARRGACLPLWRDDFP
jgi:hypothetical protein